MISSTGVKRRRMVKDRKPDGPPISAFSSTLSESAKRGRPTIPDNYLLGRLYEWTSLLEESWPEVGWSLLQIRSQTTSTINDVRKAFGPVKQKLHNPGLAQAFYRETFETATPTEVQRNRVRQGDLQAEIVRVQAELNGDRTINGRDRPGIEDFRLPNMWALSRKKSRAEKKPSFNFKPRLNRLATEERDLDGSVLTRKRTYMPLSCSTSCGVMGAMQ